MATIYVQNAPFIQRNFIVTQTFNPNHHALDLAPYGGSQALYAIDDFTIIYTHPETSGNTYGNYFIASNGNGMMYLYAHLATVPPAVGQHFNIHDYVGMAGRSDGGTGTSTGIHLHLEMQQGTSWQYNQPYTSYVNPCTYLTDIQNVVDSSNVYYYDGTPSPPTPPQERKHRFPWFILQYYK